MLFKCLKLAIGIAIGEERLVLEHLLEFLGGFHGGVFRRVDGKFNKLLPNLAHGLVGRMDHVFLVKAVVAKFIEKDFVGREVVCVAVGFADLINSQEQ